MNYESEAFRNNTKLEGRYPNYFKVGHNNFEFVLNIDQFYPENEHAQLHTRIVTTPIYTKALLETLRESVELHEQTHWAIQKEDEGNSRA